MNKNFALIRSLSLWLPHASGSTYVHIGHAGFEFLIKEIIDTRHFNLANCFQSFSAVAQGFPTSMEVCQGVYGKGEDS